MANAMEKPIHTSRAAAIIFSGLVLTVWITGLQSQVFPGRGWTVADATANADSIAIAAVSEYVDAMAGAPDSTWTITKAKVSKWFKTDPGVVIDLSFQYRTMPPEKAEEKPAIGQRYIFFMRGRPPEFSAFKILPVNDQNIAQIEQCLNKR